MNKPHDLIWKFWAAEEMATEICYRDVFIVDYLYVDNFWYNLEINKKLCQILKKEWLR